MERTGLNMHVWKGEKKSKQRLCFPIKKNYANLDRRKLKTSLPPTCLPIIGPDAPKTILPLKKIKVILNRCYDKSIYTKNIKCDFGLISLTKEFRYSGSIILFNSNDYADIRFRIKK